MKTYNVNKASQAILYLTHLNTKPKKKKACFFLTMSASYALYEEMEWVFNEWTKQKGTNKVDKVLQRNDETAEQKEQPYRIHFTLLPTGFVTSEGYIQTTNENRQILQNYKFFLQEWLGRHHQSIMNWWVIAKNENKWNPEEYGKDVALGDPRRVTEVARFPGGNYCFTDTELDDPKFFDYRIQDSVYSNIAELFLIFYINSNDIQNSACKTQKDVPEKIILGSTNEKNNTIQKEDNHSISISANTVKLLTILAVLHFGLAAIIIVALSK